MNGSVRFVDAKGTTSVEDFDAFRRLVATSNDASQEIAVDVPGSETLRIPTVALKDDASHLDDLEFFGAVAETAFSMPFEGHDSARDFFTKGDCELLAISLGRLMPHGSLHAVSDPHDDRGRRVKTPYLVHAGLRLAWRDATDGRRFDMVLDADGLTPEQAWNSTWSENGQCLEPEIETVEERDLQRMQQCRITAARLATAAPYALLLATLTPPLP